MKYNTIIILLFVMVFGVNSVYSINGSQEQDAQWIQALKDVQLAADLGSGQHVVINLDATAGLEGYIAQQVRQSIPVQKPKRLTRLQRLKAFISGIFFS